RLIHGSAWSRLACPPSKPGHKLLPSSPYAPLVLSRPVAATMPLYSPPFPCGAVGASAREFEKDSEPGATRVTIERDRRSFCRQTFASGDDWSGLAVESVDSASLVQGGS